MNDPIVFDWILTVGPVLIGFGVLAVIAGLCEYMARQVLAKDRPKDAPDAPDAFLDDFPLYMLGHTDEALRAQERAENERDHLPRGDGGERRIPTSQEASAALQRALDRFGRTSARQACLPGDPEDFPPNPARIALERLVGDLAIAAEDNDWVRGWMMRRAGYYLERCDEIDQRQRRRT